MKTMTLKTMIFLSALMIFPAHAADDKGSAAKAQLRQVQQEKRKLEQDKAQLEQDKAALDTQLKSAQESLDAVKKSSDTSSRHSSSLQKELAVANSEKTELAAKVVELKTQLDESGKKIMEMIEERRAAEVAKAQLESNLGQRSQTLASCEAKNQEQYKYGLELLDKYEKKSCFTSLLQREPFVGITKTRIENEVADYRDKVDKQHLVPAKDEVSAAP
jgi:chromosome segregation ATPase